mmetsp:Transcript_5882/g.9698  ORF Transcript_5882/g.9698 Transcript_5882/m.9698 type:complete len:653 (-) Transcript_5882:1191-3149(-)
MSAVTIAFAVHVILCTMLLQVLGPGLALNGPVGSMVRATEGMRIEQRHIIVAFIGMMVFFVLSTILSFWAVMGWRGATCSTIAFLIAARFWIFHCNRIYLRFYWEDNLNWYRDTVDAEGNAYRRRDSDDEPGVGYGDTVAVSASSPPIGKNAASDVNDQGPSTVHPLHITTTGEAVEGGGSGGNGVGTSRNPTGTTGTGPASQNVDLDSNASYIVNGKVKKRNLLHYLFPDLMSSRSNRKKQQQLDKAAAAAALSNRNDNGRNTSEMRPSWAMNYNIAMEGYLTRHVANTSISTSASSSSSSTGGNTPLEAPPPQQQQQQQAQLSSSSRGTGTINTSSRSANGWERRYVTLSATGNLFLYKSRQEYRGNPKAPIHSRPIQLLDYFVHVSNQDQQQQQHLASDTTASDAPEDIQAQTARGGTGATGATAGKESSSQKSSHGRSGKHKSATAVAVVGASAAEDEVRQLQSQVEALKLENDRLREAAMPYISVLDVLAMHSKVHHPKKAIVQSVENIHSAIRPPLQQPPPSTAKGIDDEQFSGYLEAITDYLTGSSPVFQEVVAPALKQLYAAVPNSSSSSSSSSSPASAAAEHATATAKQDVLTVLAVALSAVDSLGSVGSVGSAAAAADDGEWTVDFLTILAAYLEEELSKSG